MNTTADISLFESLTKNSCGGLSIFNDEFDDLRAESKMRKSRNRWRNSLIATLVAAAGIGGVGGVGAGLDYLGGHKDSLPVQPTAGLERVADAVHGGVNAIRGTVDGSELSDLETNLKQERLLRAFEQAEKTRERTRRLRTERELNGTKIAKENWKQADLNRGRYTDSEGKQDIGFGDAFKQGLKNNYGSIIAKLLRGAGGSK